MGSCLVTSSDFPEDPEYNVFLILFDLLPMNAPSHTVSFLLLLLSSFLFNYFPFLLIWRKNSSPVPFHSSSDLVFLYGESLQRIRSVKRPILTFSLYTGLMGGVSKGINTKNTAERGVMRGDRTANM